MARPKHLALCHECLGFRLCKNVSLVVDQFLGLHIDHFIAKRLGVRGC